LAEQSHNDDARREIMAAIRRHLAASAPFDAVRRDHQAHHVEATGAGRSVTVAPAPSGSLVERFRAALEAVAGRCIVARDERAAAEALRGIIEEKGARRVAVSDSALARAILAGASAPFETLENFAAADLFDCDLGVTGAQWAVAETGTLVLVAESERHRLASLVPPVHVAVIRAAGVRQTLAEALQSVSEKGKDDLSRTITFITGPSRTSDIELTLAIGVHGPGELCVIIIEGEAA
jgi:L-lactate dehydrogenase complex protein LldG